MLLREQVPEVNPVVVLQIWDELLTRLVNQAGKL